MLHDGNTRPYRAHMVKEFLDENKSVLSAIPRTDQTSPYDYRMFPPLKHKLSEEQFESDYEVMARVQNFLKNLPQEEF